MSYTAAERESSILCDDEEKVWTITTLQQSVITKLRKAGIQPYKVSEDGMHFYNNIPFNQVSFRAKSSRAKRTMTEDQKKAFVERTQAARVKK